jgi:hypothetical protein
LIGWSVNLRRFRNDPDPPQRFACLCFRPAEHDGVVGIANQLTQLAAAVFPESIQLVEDHIRQHAADHPTGNVANRPHEFVVRITRRKLRPSYGDGFDGAPLRSAAGQSR